MSMSVDDAAFKPMQEPLFPPPPGAERVFLSLRELGRAVARSAAGKPIPDECLNLAGIGYLEGYILDRNGENDVILFGLVAAGRPSLRLDDLIVGMRGIAAGPGGADPFVSLDPQRKNTLALQELLTRGRSFRSAADLRTFFKEVRDNVGDQTVVVGGIPRDSRQARVMIDADYHMKKVAQGRLAVAGVTSGLDQSVNRARKRLDQGGDAVAGAVSMSRFWFHVADGSPRFQARSNIVAIDRCAVAVLTEKQKVTAAGALVDDAAHGGTLSGNPDPEDSGESDADAFAAEMSEYMDCPGGPGEKVYADLQNLFRLRALLLSMEQQSAFRALGWSFQSFASAYQLRDAEPMPESLPGLANYKEVVLEVPGGTQVLFPIVCGGVGMDMSVQEADHRSDLSSELFLWRGRALAARVSPTAVSWHMND
jgi:hypothetical protein